MRVVITGGAGFVGSHLVEHFLSAPHVSDVLVIDSFEYAGTMDNLAHLMPDPRLAVRRACVSDFEAMRDALRPGDTVVHAAAQSHVDRSYQDVGPFLRSNVEGTVSMLRAAIAREVGLFAHVSTDEVYGDTAQSSMDVTGNLSPTNPYAASKAAAEMFLCAYRRSYGLETICVRSNNMYGERQHPEKLIPKAITRLMAGERFSVHGDGRQRRAFLHAQDFCRAVDLLIRKGARGATYNIASDYEYSVLEVLRMVCDGCGASFERQVRHGRDRPYNDSRYGLVCDELARLGWRQRRRLDDDIPGLIAHFTGALDGMADQAVPA